MPFNLFKKKEQPEQKPAPEQVKDAVVRPPEVAPEAVSVNPEPLPAMPLLIFDFDGTLANSLAHLVFILKNFAKSINFDADIYTYKDILNLKKVNFKNAALLRHINGLLTAVSDGMSGQIDEVGIFPGLKKLLRELREAGAVIGIVTTNRVSTVESFLTSHGLADVFHFIKSPEGPDKTKQLQEAIDEHAKKCNQIYYVSGRIDYVPVVRKIAKDKKMEVKTVGVSWGYDDKPAFQAEKIDHFLELPDELLALVAKPDITKEVSLPVQAVTAAAPSVPPSAPAVAEAASSAPRP